MVTYRGLDIRITCRAAWSKGSRCSMEHRQGESRSKYVKQQWRSHDENKERQ